MCVLVSLNYFTNSDLNLLLIFKSLAFHLKKKASPDSVASFILEKKNLLQLSTVFLCPLVIKLQILKD